MVHVLRMKKKYKKMLEGMKKKEELLKRKRREKWFLYMLQCSDQSLYTGITKDLEKRFNKHSVGKGARYTRSRRPLEMVYQEICKSRTEALVRECAVKALPKKQKNALVVKFRTGVLKDV